MKKTIYIIIALLWIAFAVSTMGACECNRKIENIR